MVAHEGAKNAHVKRTAVIIQEEQEVLSHASAGIRSAEILALEVLVGARGLIGREIQGD